MTDVCIVGVAQETTRQPGPAPEPLDSWAALAQAAALDAGAPDALRSLDSVQVVYCMTWPYDDPTGRLCERMGASPRHSLYSGIGGTVPQVLLGETADAMRRGELDTALIVGAEAQATLRTAKQAGERLAWSHRSTEKKPFPFEKLPHPGEVAHGVFQAWETFPLFDSARRAARGISLQEHEAAIGAMMAPMSEVAAANPHAWRPAARSAAEISAVTPSNRYVGWPYTKAEVAVMDVDMAAAVLLCTAEAADRLGVPADKRVWLQGWAYAADPFPVAERSDLSHSVAMKAVFDAVAGDPTEFSAFDLYSCFPSSLFFACDALGLDPLDPRGLTVTGGLPFAGGPASNYMLHAVASMVEQLRQDRGSGLVSGVGMHMTKHVAARYSTEPGTLAMAGDPQASADAQAVRPLLGGADGPAEVVAYTVAHGRDGGAEAGLLVVDTGEGRTFARVRNGELMADMESRELVGQRVDLSADGEVNTATWS